MTEQRIDLSNEPVAAIDRVLIGEPQHWDAEQLEGTVPAPVLAELGSVAVISESVDLDHGEILDEQIHMTDTRYQLLRIDGETRASQRKAREGFRQRLAPPVRGPQQPVEDDRDGLPGGRHRNACTSTIGTGGRTLCSSGQVRASPDSQCSTDPAGSAPGRGAAL